MSRRYLLPLAGLAGTALYSSLALNSPQPQYDCAIIGGGIIGLAIARECASRGFSVVLLEKNATVASEASSGNSGIGHTGYDAPEGSIERKLLRRSIRLHQHLYRTFGLSHDHVRKSGSLVVAWNKEQLSKLPDVYEENRAAGDVDAVLLSKTDLMKLDAGISDRALGAVLCPYEAVVEPWLVAMGYLESARQHGVDIRVRTKVTGVEFDGRHWNVRTVLSNEDAPFNRSHAGSIVVEESQVEATSIAGFEHCVAAKVVINAAGLYGDQVEKLTCGESSFTIVPRKGQFLVFEKTDCLDYIIEPVASQFTKGIIVWKTVYGNIVVGPTAVDQTSKTDVSTDVNTLMVLEQFARDVVPCLKSAKVVGSYSGLRPASEFRDYQISSSKQWIKVGGIRSTGLSCASAIGEYVADLTHVILVDPSFIPWIDREDNEVGVSESAASPLPVKVMKQCEKVPALEILQKNYQDRNDGTVLLYGKPQVVTHPISVFGMRSDI